MNSHLPGAFTSLHTLVVHLHLITQINPFNMFSIRSSLLSSSSDFLFCQSLCPSKSVLQARFGVPILQTRHTAGHQDPKKKITLYHGTPMSNLKEKMEHMVTKWPPTGKGDLSRTGGIYLTDSLRAAAQWACYGKSTSDGQEGGIIEYTWDGESANVYPYSSWPSKIDYQNACPCSSINGSLSRNEAKAKVAELVAFSKSITCSKVTSFPCRPMETAEPKSRTTSGSTPSSIWRRSNARQDDRRLQGACSKIVPGNSLKLDDTQGPVAKFSKAVTKELALTKVEA
ncbi:hypothetical protein CPB85DRAFT_1430239 [Mucidula mucida]|nr:hypothetical protein CPB85DRAFT_1430239 [Mucidula mucida]